MGAAIEVRGLTKRYGRILALDGLDLAVPTGSVFGFLGPNGAGKTTTIRILCSLARPTSGHASVMGVPVVDGEPTRSGLLGYLDQAPRYDGWMHGRELLGWVGHLSGLRGSALRAKVDEMLDLVGLADAGRRAIGATRAACARGWASRRRCSPGHPWSCSTNPSAPSTRKGVGTCSWSSATWPRLRPSSS